MRKRRCTTQANGRTHHRGRGRGFTLIELIATMAVVGALGSVSASILMAGMNGVMSATTSAQLHTELSMAMDRVDRELRNIPRDSAASDIAPNIDSLTAASITWAGNNTLSLVGTQLKLTLNGGTPIVLLNDVTALSIMAYNESNSPMGATLSGTGCDAIRRLRVQITVLRDGSMEILRTKLFLRCTMAMP